MAEASSSRRAWATFRRNRFALGGLIFILALVIIAVLGYLIMPDSTPQANNMTLQISLKKPGAAFTMFRFKKREAPTEVNIFEKMLFGEPDAYVNIPITGYTFKGDSIKVDEYIGDEDKPEPKNYYATQAGKGKDWDISNQTYLLGTDMYGRDMLSRLMLGTRVSLAVGLVSVIISLLLGVTIGAMAGYFGGKVDAALSWLMNILWSLPALLLVIAISFALGKGLWQIFVAVGLSMWVEVARLVRGQVISIKQMEYIEAARALGFGNARIITKHILPNIIGPVLVIASSNFAAAILLESGLSFLGFGAQPPMPTWGGMIKEHYGYIVMNAAYLAVIPGLAIMLTVYAFNLITVGLRDAFDIKSQSIRV
ncbi:MAG: ABC transporter permease [Sphingobacteriaceae bacterium]|nr:MAG: ABC transporter permease [Sphingobacteriaceae bacterium]